MPQFFVGVEAALAELLERTDRIESSLDTLHDTMTSFESAVEMLADYALALKAENALLTADDEADAAALAAAEAKVSEAEAALAAAQAEIAADTAEEQRLLARIAEVLPAAEPEPIPEEEPVVGDPQPEA